MYKFGKRRLHGSKTLALVVVGALIALSAGCSGSSSAESATGGSAVRGGTLTIAASIDSGSFDPALIQNGNQAQFWTPVFDTLLLMKPDSSVAPNLAEKYTYNTDHTVLTLNLKKGVTFTDGTKFNADAVKANIQHLGSGTGQNSFMVKSIKDVAVVDEYTAELRLSAPDPALLTYFTMAGGAMASPASFTSPNVATDPVGSGPYMLDSKTTQRGSAYSYTRNPNYWDKAAFPYDQIKIVVLLDLTARINALQSGQVSGVIADGTSVGTAKAAGLNVTLNPVNRRGLIIADRAGKIVPALGNVKVRQAINYAIDSAGLLKAIQQGYGTQSSQIFNPLSLAYDEKLNSAYPYDPAKAKSLMVEAGYADGFDILLPEAAGEKSNTIVAQQLGAIGIRVKWDKVDATNYVTTVQSGKYGMFWMSLSIGEPWWDLTKQVTTGPWNPLKSTNPELTQLLTKVSSATNDQEYSTALKAVNAWLVTNAWFDIWYAEQSVYLTAKDVKAAAHPMNVVPYIRDITPAS